MSSVCAFVVVVIDLPEATLILILNYKFLEFNLIKFAGLSFKKVFGHPYFIAHFGN